MLPRVYYISTSKSNNCIAYIIKALKLGVSLIQLRLKKIALDEVFILAKEAKRLCDSYSAILIINDYPEIAIKVKAHGVHLGKEELHYLPVFKKEIAQMTLGLTVHSYKQIKSYQVYQPNYYGLGAFRETNTKENAQIISHKELFSKEMRQVISKITTFVIGGVQIEDISRIINIGYHGVAFSSLLNTLDMNNKNKLVQLKQWIN